MITLQYLTMQPALWLPVGWFFLAVLLLDYFDISLPRGDSIAVSGALTAAAVLIFGPMPAAVICIVSVSLAQVARRGLGASRRFAVSVFARAVALVASMAILAPLTSRGISPETLGVRFAVPAAFLLGELMAAQAASAALTGRPFLRLLRGNLAVQFPLLLAQWSASVLLLITFPTMQAWSLIPVVALLFLMRQSYAMLLDIRETYRTTVEVLVEAAEGQDSRLSGHAERTATIARSIAMQCGLSANRVELISYAALLHDVDAIGEKVVSPSETGKNPSVGHSSMVFEGAHFFDDVVPILRVCDGNLRERDSSSEADLLAGFIVALASDADAGQRLEVAAVHGSSVVARVAPLVSSSIKSLAVAATLALGYTIPAVP